MNVKRTRMNPGVFARRVLCVLLCALRWYEYYVPAWAVWGMSSHDGDTPADASARMDLFKDLIRQAMRSVGRCLCVRPFVSVRAQRQLTIRCYQYSINCISAEKAVFCKASFACTTACRVLLLPTSRRTITHRPYLHSGPVWTPVACLLPQAVH